MLALAPLKGLQFLFLLLFPPLFPFLLSLLLPPSLLSPSGGVDTLSDPLAGMFEVTWCAVGALALYIDANCPSDLRYFGGIFDFLY